MLERINQTIGNIIRTFPKELLDTKDPWNGILAATMFAIRATYHTTTKATPMQLVFGRDAILNTKFKADWAIIKQQKQTLINYNNQKENKKRLPYTYVVGSKVLVKNRTEGKFGEDPWKGPYPVQKVNDNGTVRIQIGKVLDTINIRNVKPFLE